MLKNSTNKVIMWWQANDFGVTVFFVMARQRNPLQIRYIFRAFGAISITL